MYQRCLVCNTPFPPNEALEHFPLGKRVAFDPGKGRLWAICKECKRWSLAPIEERWEALDELEKLVRDNYKMNIVNFDILPSQKILGAVFTF